VDTILQGPKADQATCQRTIYLPSRKAYRRDLVSKRMPHAARRPLPALENSWTRVTKKPSEDSHDEWIIMDSI
jgi:hypothetical protein